MAHDHAGRSDQSEYPSMVWKTFPASDWDFMIDTHCASEHEASIGVAVDAQPLLNK